MKKIVALILVLAMVLGTITVAFAATNNKTFVAFGDSMTSGHGLDEKWYTFGLTREGAYAYIAAKSLGIQKDNYYSFALNAMRPTDLQFIFDENYHDSYAETYFKSNGHKLGDYMAFLPADIDTDADVRRHVQANTKNADYILYNLGDNNFLAYLITGYFGKDSPKDIIARYDKSFLQKADAIKEEYTKIVKQFIPDIVWDEIAKATNQAKENIISTFIEGLVYTYQDFIVSFDANMKWIYENNKNPEDLQLVVLELLNPFHNCAFDVKLPLGNKVSIDLEKMVDMILALPNLYMSTLSPYANKYTYVASTGHPETFIDYTAINDEYATKIKNELQAECLSDVKSLARKGDYSWVPAGYEINNRQDAIDFVNACFADAKALEAIKSAAKGGHFDLIEVIKHLRDDSLTKVLGAMLKGEDADDFEKVEIYLTFMALNHMAGMHLSANGNKTVAELVKNGFALENQKHITTSTLKSTVNNLFKNVNPTNKINSLLKTNNMELPRNIQTTISNVVSPILNSFRSLLKY